MLKSIAFTAQVALIVWIGLFQKNDVKISHDMPLSMKPGQEQLVTIDLDKSDVSGFAKLQLNMDPGLTAEPIETAGSSFTFNNQAAKFIWMALPNQKKLTLKFRIKADSDAAGLLKVSTRFSYIYENERKNVDAPDHVISLGEMDPALAQAKPDQGERNKNLTAQASVQRSVGPAGVNQWRVDVEINKGNLYGFAKVEENIPNGYTAVDLKASGAVFSIDDQIVKYIWYDMPDQEKVIVSYKLLPVIAIDASEPMIDGYFSFLRNEETISLPIGTGAPLVFAMKDDAPKNATPAPPQTEDKTWLDQVAEQKTAAAKQQPEPAKEVIETSIAATQEPKAQDTPTSGQTKPAAQTEPLTAQNATGPGSDTSSQSPIIPPKADSKAKPAATSTKTNQQTPPQHSLVSVPAPQKGVYFKVQIAAGQNNLNRPTFAKLYEFNEDFALEPHSGMLKYTTGYYSVYREARDDRERITTQYAKFKGPFVTAYNDGERITVQEALMLTSQKWYQ